MVVIPGGCTPYLQAGDIGIFRELKDKLSVAIEAWKNPDGIEYTHGGNPKPPKHSIVELWVGDAWDKVSLSDVKNSIKLLVSLMILRIGILPNMTSMEKNS